ncbi:phosphatidylserine decarboxylase proenzyme, mitochondrial [Leptopilina boulardi]|uniref:phosphatidylserine decarboxylase proenzyme, mitochondrial n=1 Tax=Leptopilina boulardi TaxID=63433 RepID=UPI0021F50D4D|nr:phosphatidylserine decarboxylase proenzyme, mitochondrial [Leptopilina boulardi]
MPAMRIYQRTVLTLKKCNSLRSVQLTRSVLSSSNKKTITSDSSSSSSSSKLNILKPWKWYIPFGFGVSFLSFYIWQYQTKTKCDKKEEEKTVTRDIVIGFYYYLPLRITSRIWGWLASCELPESLRPTLYKFYAKTFSANLDEIDLELVSFPSLVDFFVRPLRKDVRPIAITTNLVSPADGKILHIGPVTNCYVKQVKGVTYDLRNFLGDNNYDKTDNNEIKQKYITSLLKNPKKNQLYQLSIYLAPGDYHRFHSAANWKINCRKHFQGKLLSVNPKISSWLPNLFSLNERAVYIGEWDGGFMAYAVVGATNVGSIRVFNDKNLITNRRKWPKGKKCEELKFDKLTMKKGDLFGEFRMGSTIVLLFEAPRDFHQFTIKDNQRILVGQGITDCHLKSTK